VLRSSDLALAQITSPAARTAVVAALVTASGVERRVMVALRNGDPAWLVDWPVTRELWE
jgi:hypothetical protein